MMDRAPGGQRLPCLCRTILKFWSHSLGSDIIDVLIAMACEVLAQSSVRTLFFALCEWPLYAVACTCGRGVLSWALAFAEVITNVACTCGRGVLSGRLSLGLPQLQQKPAEHHSHADEIQELWGVWRRG